MPVLLIRLAIGALLWSPVYSALTWDDFTRVLIARNWASDPFVSADIVWLPAQTWLLGSLFRVTGDLFSQNPMLLVAILNTVLVVGTALVVRHSTRLLTGSETGGWLALLIILFSPWGFYASLSGLAEPIYYLATAVAFASLVHTALDGETRWWGAAGVALAAATRYEGWWLAVAWSLTIGWIQWKKPERRLAIGNWLPLGLPFAVPAGWMVYNRVTTGSPLTFLHRSAEYFSSAFGGPPTVLGRIVYYPAALLRADALLLVLILLGFWIARHDRAARVLFATVTIHGALFVGTGIVGSAVGAFNERFMFAFLVAASPLLGFLPDAIGGMRHSKTVWVMGASVVVAVTGLRVADPPVEWSHAPDLLATMEALDDIAPDDRRLTVSIPPGMAPIWATPLATFAGDRISLTVDETAPPEIDVRVAATVDEPGYATAFGRFGVSGRLAGELDGGRECSCDGWVTADETGHVLQLGEPSLAWAQFSTPDPPPDSRTVVSTRFDGSTREVEVEVRSPYGHGFNPRRMTVTVTYGGRVLETWDIAEPSRWKSYRLQVPPDGAEFEVTVTTSETIETGWDWGSASTVLVRVGS